MFLRRSVTSHFLKPNYKIDIPWNTNDAMTLNFDSIQGET